MADPPARPGGLVVVLSHFQWGDHQLFPPLKPARPPSYMLDVCKVNHENTVVLRGVSESRLFTHVAKGG